MKKICLLLLLVFVGSVCAADATTGLVGWWKMDGPTSGQANTYVRDYSGNDNHGTMGSSDAWITSGGIDFSGGSSGLSGIVFTNSGADLIADMGLTDQVTISFIMSGHTPGDKGYAFSGKDSTSNHIMSMEAPTGDGVHFLTKMGTTASNWMWNAFDSTHINYIFLGSPKVRITATVDFTAGKVTYYLDDSVWGTFSDVAGSFSGLTSFTIGREPQSEYDCSMEDFRIYNRVLSPDDVVLLANPPSPADLNGDGLVNMDDVELLVYDWLVDSLDGNDINEDGTVNFIDYAILLNNWKDGEDYYFDSVGGNDNNTGKSPDQAWQSLNKFNGKKFSPGDEIYFKAGSQWSGQIRPKGSGIAARPIIIDAYGDITDENNKPRFDGNGSVGSTLSVSNVEYWEINNLQVTNLGATRAAYRKGVSIDASNFGTMRHIHLKNLYVHSVNGLIVKEDGGGCGISWFCGGDIVLTKFDGILIDGCHIKTTDRDGIVGGNTRIGRLDNNPSSPATTKDFYPSVNVIVRGNLLEDIGGDAIVPIGTDGCVVEYNTVTSSAVRTYNYNPKQWAAAIWPWSADNTIIRYNIVTGTKGTNDGQSFDADYNTRGTIIEYNYSYSNEGGFVLVCNGGDNTVGITGNRDTIIRYNISINNGGGDAGTPMLQTNGLCTNVQIYNNIFVSPAVSTPYFQEQQSVKSGSSFYWSNNIFYSNATTGWRYRQLSSSGTMTWSNNCFFGNFQKYQTFSWSTGYPPDSAYITADPQFVALPNPPSSADAESADGFMIHSTSPCIGAGKIIINNGGYDFWGNTLYNGSPDIGAQEY